MSANNTFSLNRFLLLAKRHYIHNNRLMLFSIIAYCGVVFVVLSLAQLDNLTPLDAEYFTGFLIGSTAVFGILFTGHAFPAFRNRETATNYITLPASTLEKYVFEFIYRIGLSIVLLPILFWITFHLQGYFFQLFIEETFLPIGLTDVITMSSKDLKEPIWIPLMLISVGALVLTIPFAGAAFFVKQPLVKTLFSVGIIIIFYVLYVYVVFVLLGLEHYHTNDSLILIPNEEQAAFRFLFFASATGNAFMLLFAYLKLKEKEV